MITLKEPVSSNEDESLFSMDLLGSSSRSSLHTLKHLINKPMVNDKEVEEWSYGK